MKMSLMLRYMTLTTVIMTQIMLKLDLDLDLVSNDGERDLDLDLDLVASTSRSRCNSRPPKRARSTHYVDLDLCGRGSDCYQVLDCTRIGLYCMQFFKWINYVTG